MVAANRSRLTTLVATNLFGRNTQAIAANEAQYGEMWAQDAAVMYGYAASSASATSLTPFTPPQQNTNPGGSAGQAAAVSEATGTSAGNVQSTVSSIQQAFSAVPNALQSAATPAQSTSLLDTLGLLGNLEAIFLDAPASLAELGADAPLTIAAFYPDVASLYVGEHTDQVVSDYTGKPSWLALGAPWAPPVEAATTTNLGAPVSAGLGEANTVGALSVPPTWTVATPAVRPVAYTLPALPATPTASAGPAGGAGSSSTLSEMALAGMAGRAMAGTMGTGGGRGGGKGAKGAQVAARSGAPPATGDSAKADGQSEAPESKPRTVVTGVAAELREFAKLRDEGILTDEEYTEQKNRLLGR
jgi:PPE-repeat protein